MKIKLPTALIESINFYISNEKEFENINIKQRQKLNSKLINLWYIIFSHQVDNFEKSLRHFVNISRNCFKPIKFFCKPKTYEYNELLNFLSKWKLIEINHKYCSPNSSNLRSNNHSPFSKSYKVKTDFLSQTQFTEIEIDFEIIFRNTKKMEFWIDLYPDYKSLIIDSYNTTIQLDEFISWLYMNEGMELKGKLINGVFIQRFLTPYRIIKYINTALKIQYKNLWFKVSKEGRFYSSLTNLPSVTLPFLQLYNEEIIELDVANCQPLLLAHLIDNEEYKKDVEEGLFYSKMASLIGWTTDRFKIMSYRYLFFSNRPLKGGLIYKALNQMYPNLVDQINNLKKENKLAVMLQKIESEIFVKKIGVLPFKKITRHDSVMTTRDNYNDLKKIIRDEFSNLNLSVTIK